MEGVLAKWKMVKEHNSSSEIICLKLQYRRGGKCVVEM